MTPQSYAAAIAAEFRSVGIYRTTAYSTGPEVQEDGRITGPVCFWINNTGFPPLDFMKFLSGGSLVNFLDHNSDELVLATLDRIAAGD